MIGKKFSFGVGCFNFGLNRKSTLKFTGKQYIDATKSTLELIPSITEINFWTNDKFLKHNFLVEGPLPQISESFGFFPSPGLDCNIDFKVHIPKRLHKKISPLENEIPCENFYIKIINSYYFPVTYIFPLDNVFDLNASDAVVLVREFLKSEFKRLKNSKIRFECIGPSPFHADFHAMPANSSVIKKLNRLGIYSELIESRGYNSINLYFLPKLFRNPADLREKIYKLFTDELSVFYQNILIHTNQNRQWLKLENQARELIKIEKIFWANKSLGQFFGYGLKIKNIILAISEFEIDCIWEKFEIDRSIKNINKGKASLILKPHFESESFESPQFPIAQARETISFLEQRRSKFVDNIVLLIYTIIGGTIGSVITLAFTR